MTPINKLKIRDAEFTNVIDLQIHRRPIMAGDTNPSAASEYFMYVVSTNGVLLYSQIEKREDCKTVNDNWGEYQLSPNCSDINSQGVLLVDA